MSNRTDVCLALRIIALQEMERKAMEALDEVHHSAMPYGMGWWKVNPDGSIEAVHPLDVLLETE